MGRGRQKAKATKQARDMKYYSPSTDYSALERELSSGNQRASYRDDKTRNHPEDADKYADAYDDEDEHVHGR